MSLLVQVLSTLMMEFPSKNLYNCREPIVLVWCIFSKFIILILYIFLNYESQYILEITTPSVSAGYEGLNIIKKKKNIFFRL
jgi:hypothetical protein